MTKSHSWTQRKETGHGQIKSERCYGENFKRIRRINMMGMGEARKDWR